MAASVTPASKPGGTCSGGMEKLPLKEQLLYSVGQLGWSVVSMLTGQLLVYFYIPSEDPETGELDFPEFITRRKYAAIFNVIVILACAGRLWDAVTDPLIASYSDRLTHRRGRRIPCMAVGALPCAACCVALFFPPVSGASGLNILWLGAMQCLFFLFLTLYCTPYFALLPELGHTEQQRLDLSMWTSIAFAAGSVVAGAAPLIGSMLRLNRLDGLRAGVITTCFLATLFMYVPVFTINERRYCRAEPTNTPLGKALRHCLANRNFRAYVAADFGFFFATAMIQTGMPFYLTVLLEQSVNLLAAMVGGLVLLSLVWYYPINRLSSRWGKKRLVLFAMGLASAFFALLFFLGKMLPFSYAVQLVLIPVLGSLPISILGMLPTAILADIAVHDAATTATSNEGMFFAARTLLQKLGQTFGVMCFAGLTNFGSSVGDDLGVRLSGPVGVVVMLLATLAFCFYDEKTLVAELSQIRRRDEARARGAAEEETPSTAATDSRTITPRSPRQRHASRAAVHPA